MSPAPERSTRLLNITLAASYLLAFFIVLLDVIVWRP